MEPASYDELRKTLEVSGPGAAIDELCRRLREGRDYRALFYARLLQARHELGVSAIPTGPSADLPASAHEPYEESIRKACREVGGLFLADGAVPDAWGYFRMIGEPGPVAEALAAHEPGEDEDLQTLVQLAYYEGLQPKKGFDWVLDRYGVCNAITTLGGQDPGHPPEVRRYCVGRLVRALYRDLRERLLADIERVEGRMPEHDGERPTVKELLVGREKLFEEGFAHIDTSHLSSVVQMSGQLEPGEELELARHLCAYGEHLPKHLQYHTDPPFEEPYRDYGKFLGVIAGDGVEEGLAHFRAKAEAADPETVGTYPAQVLVNLLLRAGRTREAMEAGRKFLAAADSRYLSCPGLFELCQRAGEPGALAEVARQQNDPVHYLAGLIESRRK